MSNAVNLLAWFYSSKFIFIFNSDLVYWKLSSSGHSKRTLQQDTSKGVTKIVFGDMMLVFTFWKQKINDGFFWWAGCHGEMTPLALHL